MRIDGPGTASHTSGGASPKPGVRAKDGPTNDPEISVKDGKIILPGGKAVDPPAPGKFQTYAVDERRSVSISMDAQGNVYVTGWMTKLDPHEVPKDAHYVEIDATWDAQQAATNNAMDSAAPLPAIGSELPMRDGKVVLPNGQLVDPPPPNTEKTHWMDATRGLTIGRAADGKVRVTGHASHAALKGTVPVINGRVQLPGSDRTFEAPKPGKSKTYELYNADGVKGSVTITTSADGKTATYEYGKELPTFWNRVKSFFNDIGKWIKIGLDFLGTLLSWIPGANLVGAAFKIAAAVWGVVQGIVDGDWVKALGSAIGGFAAGAKEWGSKLLSSVAGWVSKGFGAANGLGKAIEKGDALGIADAVVSGAGKLGGSDNARTTASKLSVALSSESSSESSSSTKDDDDPWRKKRRLVA